MYEKKPWLKHYGAAPQSIDYPRVTMYEALMQTVEKYPDRIAYDFFDYTSTYKQFAEDIDICADALASLGLRKGDRITISMPTSPQGVICFYAANKLGVVASMIHPLSTPAEIAYYLNVSRSRIALTVDLLQQSFMNLPEKTPLELLILTEIFDQLTKGQPMAEKPASTGVPAIRWWKDLMTASLPVAPKADMHTDEMAVILYSGGTTGFPKGIMLSNYNFISEGLMVFSGDPGRTGVAEGPFSMRDGMNRFLQTLGITFRRDQSGRPRINKPGSFLDREQRATGDYYYSELTKG